MGSKQYYVVTIAILLYKYRPVVVVIIQSLTLHSSDDEEDSCTAGLSPHSHQLVCS